MQINLQNSTSGQVSNSLNINCFGSNTAANLEKLANLRIATSKLQSSSEILSSKYSANFAKNGDDGKKIAPIDKETQLIKLQNLIKSQKIRSILSVKTTSEKMEMTKV